MRLRFCIDDARVPKRGVRKGRDGYVDRTPPYSTYSSLLYASSTGFTPRDHIEEGIECFGATGRSSSCTE